MRVYRSPLYVDFDITLRCNLRCLHCNVDGGDPLPYEMSTKKTVALVQELYEAGVMELAITGGEPLCHPEWLSILKTACSLEGWNVILNTNGLLWREEYSLFVNRLPNPPKIMVSLDGFSPKTYGVLRRLPSGVPADDFFPGLIDNLRSMRGYDLDVSLNFTVTEITVDNFFATVKLAHQLGLKGVAAIKLFSYGRALQNHSKLDISYKRWSEFLRKLTELKMAEEPFYDRVSVSPTCPWEIFIPLLDAGWDAKYLPQVLHYVSPLSNKYYSSKHNLGCTAGVTNCAISPDGTVYPCGTVSAKIKGLECGSVVENDFTNIWFDSVLLNRLRDISLDIIKAPCSTCDLAEVCGGGCRARAFVITGQLEGPDVLCPKVEKVHGDINV